MRLASGRAYNPSARGMHLVAEHVRQHFKDRPQPLLKGPLLVIVHFVLPAPISQPETRRRKQNLLPHMKRPDGDNLEKYLNDALSGVVWNDDAQITWILRSKTITSEKQGYTIFYAEEIGIDEPNYDELLLSIRENIYIKKGEENEND